MTRFASLCMGVAACCLVILGCLEVTNRLLDDRLVHGQWECTASKPVGGMLPRTEECIQYTRKESKS